MSLNQNAYQALENVVGSEYITQEPVIMDTYNQVWMNKLLFNEKYATRPGAVVMPANTEEIQKIVRICNQYSILFKAFASGFEYVGLALEREDGILLDLQRMNRILEIDAKNMRAVVEPFVSTYELQLEAAKYGLYTGRIGAGYSSNVIACACCHQEMSHTQVFTSGFGRNILGAEWVLPSGDLVELGTSGRPGGWYSADGPGFSLRGILRGRSGANGGNGIFTKASVKLYPWYGPPEWENVRQVGKPPITAQIEKIPDEYKSFIITFPDMDNMLKACIDICHAEIATMVWGGNAEIGFPQEGNDEEWEAMQKTDPELKGIAQKSLSVIIGSDSKRELAYREKYIYKIMQKYDGILLPQLNNSDSQTKVFIYHLWSCGTTATLRPTGDFIASISGGDTSVEALKIFSSIDAEGILPYVESGAFYQPVGGVTFRPLENLSIGASGGRGIRYDPWDSSTLDQAKKYVKDMYDPAGRYTKSGFTSRGALLFVESIDHIYQNWGPLYDNCDIWLRKVKRMLDPNNVCDSTAYIPAD